MKTRLVSVYGSLRKGMGNHRLLENSTFVGTFRTDPVYSLYSLGGFPGLKENGNTSVVMEVYEVDDDTNERLDSLEGYSEDGNNTFYDKVTIQTPWGESGLYIYVPNVSRDRLVESGDWKEYKEQYKPESWL